MPCLPPRCRFLSTAAPVTPTPFTHLSKAAAETASAKKYAVELETCLMDKSREIAALAKAGKEQQAVHAKLVAERDELERRRTEDAAAIAALACRAADAEAALKVSADERAVLQKQHADLSGKWQAAAEALSEAGQRADALDGQVAALAGDKELAERAVAALKKKLAAAEAAACQASAAAETAAAAAARDLKAMTQQRDAEAAAGAERAARIAELEDMLRVTNDEVASLSAALRDAKSAGALLEKERNGLRAQVRRGTNEHNIRPRSFSHVCTHRPRRTVQTWRGCGR